MTTIRDAYKQGYDVGYDIASENIHDFRPGENNKEEFVSLCCVIESDHYRQFSPFEFTAKEFNESRNPDRVWESYEDGVYKGVLKRIKEYFRNGG